MWISRWWKVRQKFISQLSSQPQKDRQAGISVSGRDGKSALFWGIYSYEGEGTISLSWCCSVLIELDQDGHFPSALQSMQSQPISLTLAFERVLLHLQKDPCSACWAVSGCHRACIFIWDCNKEGAAGLPFLSLTLFTMVSMFALKKKSVLRYICDLSNLPN